MAPGDVGMLAGMLWALGSVPTQHPAEITYGLSAGVTNIERSVCRCKRYPGIFDSPFCITMPAATPVYARPLWWLEYRADYVMRFSLGHGCIGAVQI